MKRKLLIILGPTAVGKTDYSIAVAHKYGSPVIWDWNMFTMMMIYIVVHFSTAIISYSMISLLRTEKHRKEHLFLPGLFASAVVAFALMEAYETGSLKVFYITGICAVTSGCASSSATGT